MNTEIQWHGKILPLKTTEGYIWLFGHNSVGWGLCVPCRSLKGYAVHRITQEYAARTAEEFWDSKWLTKGFPMLLQLAFIQESRGWE